MFEVLPMYNVHSYFSLKNLGKKVYIIHSIIRKMFKLFKITEIYLPPPTHVSGFAFGGFRYPWSLEVQKYLSGGFNAAPRSTTDEEKDYQDMICLGGKSGPFSHRRTAQSLSLQGFLLGSLA